MNMQRSLDYSIKNTNFLRTYILNLQKDIQDLKNQNLEPQSPKRKEEPLPIEDFHKLESSISKHKANLNYMSMIPRLKQEFTRPSLKHENRCFQSELVTERHRNPYQAKQIVKRFESASEAQLTSSEIELSSSRFEPGLNQVNQNLSAEKDFKKTPKTDFQSQELFKKIERDQDESIGNEYHDLQGNLESLRQSIVKMEANSISILEKPVKKNLQIQSEHLSSVEMLKKQSFFYFQRLFKHFLDVESQQNLSTKYQKSLKNFLCRIYKKKANSRKKDHLKTMFMLVFFDAIDLVKQRLSTSTKPKEISISSEKESQNDQPNISQKENGYLKMKIIKSSCESSKSDFQIEIYNQNFDIFENKNSKMRIREMIMTLLIRNVVELSNDSQFSKLLYAKVNFYIDKINKRVHCREMRLSNAGMCASKTKKKFLNRRKRRRRSKKDRK